MTDVNGSGGRGEILFTNGATAGSSTVFTNNGASSFNVGGGFVEFAGSSSAGNSSFINNGGSVYGAIGGSVLFEGTSTAGNATCTNNGASVSDGIGGETDFFDSSSAGSATLVVNGGTNGGFGGHIFFDAASSGGTARIEIFGNGSLDISLANGPAVGVGSIQGNGNIFLGSNNLIVGSNNLSTVFSGLVQQGSSGGTDAGSLTKVGTGRLTLSNASTYAGGTTLSKGTFLVKNTTGSATGTGAVQVNGGTLAGVGIISGAVTVGNGTTSGAILLAGNSKTSPGTLTINNTLTFNSGSTYKCVLNRSSGKASKITAVGVTINSSVPFTFVDTGSGTLATGTVFTIINNTSANPIFGTFSNLSDGMIFTSNGTNFKVRYTGGTGNDLTLKVVP